MNFAHGVQIPDEFNFALFPDDFGYLWAPEADIDGVHGSTDYSIQNPIVATSEQTSTYSSRTESSYSQEYDNSANNEDAEADDSETSRVMGRPRFPLQYSRDPNMNRIQRRRIQNRNSQRIYRQRRVEERQKFETRAIEAEKTASELRTHLGELNSIIASLKHQVEQLKAENSAFRRCSQLNGNN